MKATLDSNPRLTYSDPERGEDPRLVTFSQLNEQPDLPQLPIRDNCATSRRFRLVDLPRSESGEVIVHVYSAVPGKLVLRLYGVDGETLVPIAGCREVGAVAGRAPLKVPDGYDAYKLRVDVVADDKQEEVLTAEHQFSLAAYDGEEPRSPGGVTVAGREKGEEKIYLPFSHNRRSFQRIVIATCDPQDDIRGLIRDLGLQPDETYFGKFGSVAVLGVPPGMSLNTTIDHTTKKRPTGHQGEGTVSEDYIVNLFSPATPTHKNEEPEDRWNNADQPAFELPRFSPPDPGQFDRDRKPLTVAIIDSGIDYSQANARHWESTRYESGPNTEYITTGGYGYDFIRRRPEPVDEAPHGTYVAATVLNQYRAKRPLQLLHMKVFGAQGIASYFGALVSIYEAIAAGARVINMSWGFYEAEPPRELYCAIKTAARHDIVLVASAGNENCNLDQHPQWPASFADDFPCNLVTVASYEYDLGEGQPPTAQNVVRTGYSNYGIREVPLAAFLTSPVPEFVRGTTYYPVGTSISAPIVTGLLADWLSERPYGTLAEFRQAYYGPADRLKPEIGNGYYLPHTASPWMV